MLKPVTKRFADKSSMKKFEFEFLRFGTTLIPMVEQLLCAKIFIEITNSS